MSTQLMDVAWSSFILAGIEKMRLTRHFTATNDLDLDYIPYSHGLIASAGWSVLAALATYILLPGCTPMAAALMGAVCFSHWWLDLLVHPRDLPLIGNSYKVGLGLWNYRMLTLVLELVLLFGGAALYMASLGAGASGLWWFTLVISVALAALHMYSLFGPPVESVPGYASQALAAYLVAGALCYGAERWLAPLN